MVSVMPLSLPLKPSSAVISRADWIPFSVKWLHPFLMTSPTSGSCFIRFGRHSPYGCVNTFRLLRHLFACQAFIRHLTAFRTVCVSISVPSTGLLERGSDSGFRFLITLPGDFLNHLLPSSAHFQMSSAGAASMKTFTPSWQAVAKSLLSTASGSIKYKAQSMMHFRANLLHLQHSRYQRICCHRCYPDQPLRALWAISCYSGQLWPAQMEAGCSGTHMPGPSGHWYIDQLLRCCHTMWRSFF